MRTIDTSGKKCPIPIIETKKALRETPRGETFIVLTDSITSFKNISRFLTDNKIRFTASESHGLWTFNIINETASTQLTAAEIYCEPEQPANLKGNYSIAVTSEFMGSGDDSLGRILMRAFFVSLSCFETLPEVIVFYNSGVKLAARDSDVINLLREIEDKGVEMILCGTCVDHYKLAGSVGVGKIGDMYLILEKLSASGKVIRP